MIPLEKILSDPNSSFKVLTLAATADQFSWDYHFHPETEIVYIHTGNGRRHVGSHISYFTNGDLVLIGANVPHAGFGYGAKGLHKATVIQFDHRVFNELFENTEFAKIKQMLAKAHLGLVFMDETKKKLELVIKAISQTSGVDRFLKLIEILEILAGSSGYQVLNEDPNTNIKFTEQERLKSIFDLVEDRYAQNLSSIELAQLCHMTHPAFCNYFKKQMGLTFTTFLTQFRLKKACEMLAQNHNVSEVAFATGFESLAYFSRVFKQSKRLTPSDFKKTLKI